MNRTEEESIIDSLINPTDKSILQGYTKVNDNYMELIALIPLRLSPLDTLLIEQTDSDQLWEQLQLLNIPLLDYISKEIKRLKQDLLLTKQFEMESESEESLSINESESEFDSESESETYLDDSDFNSPKDLNKDALVEEDSDSSLENELDVEMEEMNAESDEEMDEFKMKRKKEKTIVDDEFFSLREMENFAEMAEEFDMVNGGEIEDSQITESRKRKIMSTFGPESEDEDDDERSVEDEDADLIDSDENANEIRYEDFFGEKEHIGSSKSQKPSKGKKVHESKVEDDYYSENESSSFPNKISSNPIEKLKLDHSNKPSSGVQSTFEKKQNQMNSIIEELESEAIREKHWVLKGEASSKIRPMNSLLEEDLEVDYNKRPAPIITEENTQTIEDMIKQRILDDLFDDVERKIPPKERNFDPNRKIVMNDVKSTKSLAQVYEDEFLKQKQGDLHKSEKETALENTHKEIQTLFDSICSNLDALSNWHFTPKALTIDLQVLPSVALPAISMEDTLPSAVNTVASTLAPKEIYDGKVQKSQVEKDSDDKRRERSAKKSAFKKRKIEEKLTSKLREQQIETNPNIQKEKAVKELLKDKNVTFIDNKKTPRLKDSKQGAKSMRQGETIGAEKKDMRTSQNFKL